MRARNSSNGLISAELDLDSPLGRLAMVNISLAQQRIQEQEISIKTQWQNNPHRIVYQNGHFLYDKMFYIYALRMHQGKVDENISFLIDAVVSQAQEILDYLSKNPEADFNKVDEQLRFEYLIGAYLIIANRLDVWQTKQCDALIKKIIAICRALDYQLPIDAGLIRNMIRNHQSKLTKSADAINALDKKLLLIIGGFKNFTTTVEWNNTHYSVDFSTSHPLYHDILEIYAVSKLTPVNPAMAKFLVDDIQHSLRCIKKYLSNKPKIALHDKSEQLRWGFLLVNLAHTIGASKFYQLCEIQPLLDQVREVMMSMKPMIKTHHKIVKRYYKLLELDLDTIIGIDCLERKDFISAEVYLNGALHLASKYLVNDIENRQGTLFLLNNHLSQLHFTREDYLAAEVQYDNAMRYISKNMVPGNIKQHQSKKLSIIHFELARHFQKTGETKNEIRTLRKAIEVCDLFLDRAMIVQLFPDVKKQTQIIKMICQKRLAEIAQNPQGNEKKNNKKSLPTKKEKPSTTKKATPVVEPSGEICDSEVTPSFPLLHIPVSWKANNKKISNTRQKKPKDNPRKNDDNQTTHKPDFFSTQQRTVPNVVLWEDETFGELRFDKSNADCDIIVMRDEHNCGCPVFGFLCTDLIEEELKKHYQAPQVDIIMKEMIKTFSEAKKAGFFGRGIKSCPNLPLLKGTDYKMALKPSSGFDFTLRVYGRTLHNGKHTLFIFNAIDVKPKGSASKLVILEPKAKQVESRTNILC